VLTIGKLGVSRGRLEYYEAQVAAGVEDYYAGRGESPGRWRGSGAHALGLARDDRVERSAFMALMRGRSPVDGQVLRSMGQRSTVAGLDLTFSAPKSVSVLFAVADDETSKALLAAHERAVDATLGYLERQACFTRRGRDGAERLRGEGFIAASYRHRMSRAGDPQLHTHVVVGNLTRAEGCYTALDARALYEHKFAGGAMYRAVLRAEVRERLPWVSWRPSGRGLFEIDGVSEDVLRHFSQRRVEIEERAAELVGVGAGGLSRDRMQAIATATRRAKRYGVDGGAWCDQARARAAEHGFGQRELSALRSRAGLVGQDVDVERVFERLSGPLGLTEMHNTFARRHALGEIAGEFRQGAAVAQLEETANQYLADASVRRLQDEAQGECRYTTVGLLACERQIVDGAARRSSERVAELPGELVDRILTASAPILNDDQAAAVRSISSSGRGVDAVSALAGSGKTTMIGTVASCYRDAGWDVLGAAPTGRAARQLRDAAGIPADTMHALLLRLTQTGGFPSRTVLVLDEAGMAPTRLTARLFAQVERAGVKVIAVGDPGQLGSVQAGGWLAAITADQDRPTLAQAIRQHDASEREALEALRDGDPDSYLAYKEAQITVHDTETAAIRRLIDDWNSARHQHGAAGAVMIARDNWTRELAIRAARAQLKHDGDIPSDGVIVGGREYAPGDRVIARRNHRHHDVDNGTLATVIAVDPQTGAMIVHTDRGEPRALDPSYVADHLQHAYALTAHGAQGATVNWAAVIGRPEEFTREWAYTALSRARHQTNIHVIAEPPEREREREQYAPPAPERDLAEVRHALRFAMRRVDTEPLAISRTAGAPANADGTGARSPSAESTQAARESSPKQVQPLAGTKRDRGSNAHEKRATQPRALHTPEPAPTHSADGTEAASALTQPVATPAHLQRQRLKGLDRLRRNSQQRQGPTLGL
jgi:conjugative relaxase-like TrwC/TraI family protein